MPDENPLSRVRAFQRAANPNGDYRWPAEEAANIGGIPLYFDDIEALASTDDLDAVEVAIRCLCEAEAAVKTLREQLAAATARAETAEAAYHRLDSAQAAAGSYAGRAEAAEAALAAVLNLHREADAQDGDWEHGPHWPCVVCHDGPWPCATRRAVDATPYADLDRLAAEKGVQPVTSIDQLTAPEGERLSDEEWTAYAEALGIEPGVEKTVDTPPLPERQAQLLAAIRKEGGDWSPARARDALACLGYDVTPERGHQIMKSLAERGHLEQVRPRAYTYRLKGEGSPS